MQDVTDLPFMQVMQHHGGPDWYVTEYFRVHSASRLESWIVRSITENSTGRPVIAQMIGQDIPDLVRTAKMLEKLPVGGVDLNLGCPAPIVCKKDAGGGLLRHPERIDAILTALRDTVQGNFTVKCRLGFAAPDEFSRLLEVFQKHRLDLLTIHGRTVADGYRTPVHTEHVTQAVAESPFPVIANGNVVDVPTGLAYAQRTQAAGLMIGRGAIRNPWLFQQLKNAWEGSPQPTLVLRDVLAYIQHLYDATASYMKTFVELPHVAKMKKYLCYISQGVDEAGGFEYDIRRAKDATDFFRICRQWLDHDTPYTLTPPEKSKLFCGFRELVSTEAMER
jgi:tRNA-dihydrouridine synthase